MSGYIPSGLPFESQELPCRAHPQADDVRCTTCQYIQIQRRMNNEQAQRARGIIDQAIQNHSTGQYTTFGDRSLEQDIWNEIQGRATSLQSSNRGRDLCDLTLAGSVYPAQLINSDSRMQEAFGEQQAQDNNDYSDGNLIPDRVLENVVPSQDPISAGGSIANPPQSLSNTNLEAESEQHSTVGDGGDGGIIMQNRCQRCRRLKKGCDRQRPCQRCRQAGLGFDDCIPLAGRRPTT